MATSAAADFITSQRFAYADLPYAELDDLYARRQWHQLTEALLTFVSDSRSDRGDNLLQLYSRFISTFEGKLKPLRVVQIVAAIARQYYPSRPYVGAEVERAIELVTKQVEKRGKTGEERLPDDAHLVARAEVTSLLLKRSEVHAVAAASGNAVEAAAALALLDDCKKRLEEERTDLAALPDVGVDRIVAATVHRVAAEYYKIRGPPAAFYTSALAYLANTNVTAMPLAERQAYAVDVAVAALVGEGVYNFGEVNVHPILAALDDTPHAWLKTLLAAFQTGDIRAFNAAMGEHRAAFEAQPALVAATAAIKEKITLLSVMELAAKRPAADRVIPFYELATETSLGEEHIEWLLMRAMSLGLIRGVIDEVDQTVAVTFIRPRVLDIGQIAALKAVVDDWRDRARTNLVTLEGHLRDVLG